VPSIPVSSAFVGRATDVAALEDALADERIAAVLVGGEPGIGKSRLVSEFTGRLDQNVLVLVGRCPEFGADGVPYAPFIAAMRGALRQSGAQELAALRPADLALAYEILTLLEQLALTRPVVLVLEDLHWADDSSRDLLAFLVANLAQSQVLLVGTYRPAEPGSLRELIAELSRHPGVRLVSPRPLTRHEVGRQLAALLGREPGPALITGVFERSGGNPLFVEALSQSPEQMPAGLTGLLLGFQARLTAGARAVLRVAAVIGSPVRHELLAESAGLAKDTLHTALRELVDRQLLLVTDTGYEFRHVLIRQAVYDDLLPAERTDLHARLAGVLSTRPDPLTAGIHRAELARHAAAMGDLPRALTASWQAAAAADVHPQRLRQLERVLELWDQVPSAAELLGTTKPVLLEQIADTCARGGAVERGIEAASAALALIDSGTDPRRAAHLYHQRAYLLGKTGAGPGADLQAALRLLPADPPCLERGEVLAELALTRVFSGDEAGAAADAGAAVQIAERFGATALAARGYAYLGLAAAGQPDTAAGLLARARAAAIAAGDPHTLLDVITWESSVLLAAGDYLAGIAVIQQGLRIAHEAFLFGESAPILLVKWAQALTALGRWPQALSLIEEAQADEMPPLSRAALLLCHARIALAQGDPATAQAMAAEAGHLLGTGQWALAYRMQLRAVQCLLALEEGRPADAARILTETGSGTGSAAALAAHPHQAWPLVVLAARVPDAPADLLALAGTLPWACAVDAAHRAVFTARTDATAARWDDAAAAWHALGQRYDEACCRLSAAQAHAAEGNRAAATSSVQAAAGIAAELGAAPLTEAAQQLARRARLSIDQVAAGPPEPAPGGFGLTQREREVLGLVAKGMSNRQLAAELFISANTAGVHVSRILTKLGVASRTEAAAFAHEHHLL